MREYECAACHDSGFHTVLDSAETELTGFNVYVQTEGYCVLDCEYAWRERMKAWKAMGGMRSFNRNARALTTAADKLLDPTRMLPRIVR